MDTDKSMDTATAVMDAIDAADISADAKARLYRAVCLSTVELHQGMLRSLEEVLGSFVDLLQTSILTTRLAVDTLERLEGGRSKERVPTSEKDYVVIFKSSIETSAPKMVAAFHKHASVPHENGLRLYERSVTEFTELKVSGYGTAQQLNVDLQSAGALSRIEKVWP